ncbi:uncharacterized protein [Dermacentor albipictus]|uniref:uncharacterized protein n=1 Tax=Dermacentor albipictus TaxID=60249 RepID=UPI0038FCCBA3
MLRIYVISTMVECVNHFSYFGSYVISAVLLMSAGQELSMDYYQPAALQGTTLQHGRHRNVSEQSLDIDTSGLRTTTTWFEGQEAPLSSTSPLLSYIKAAKGQRPFSGRGESIGTMHLNNPLLFFIQAVLLMSAGQELSMDYYQHAALQGTTLQHGRHRNVSEQSLDIDTSGLRTTTTWFEGQEAPLPSTTPLLSYIKAAKGQRPFSGRGESIGTMHLNNPLLFFIQAVLLMSAGQELSMDYYQHAALQGTTLQHGRHRNVSEQSLDIDTSGLRTTTTWFEGQEAPLSSTSPLLGYIKAAKGQRPFSGHGESIGTMHLNNPLLFFIQVSDYRQIHSYRSNDPCLLILPCPRPLLAMLTNVYLCFVDIISCCGDIESNPGPSTDEMLKNIMHEIREIKATMSSSSQRLEDKLNSIDKKIDDVAVTVAEYTCKVDKLQTTVDHLNLKVDELENRSRRNNLILYGLQERKGEQHQTLEQEVSKKFLEDVLQIPNVKIERIHRLGRPCENKCRPVILKLVDGRDKTKILSNCGRLKGTPFSISEDFSPRVQLLRKRLWECTKQNRNNHDKVVLTYDKVRINGKLHRWDDTLNKAVPVSDK